MKKTLYFENLDGLRFLSFLSVFFYHSFYTASETIKTNPAYHFVKNDVFGNGNLGVNFFFVLSGFLITYLLLEEKKANGQISLGKFWMRRILRIWPLFYLMVLFGFVAFPLIKQAFGQTPAETAHLLSYLTFTNNFDFIANGPPDSSVLGVLWSVAIEEQFYLVWPLVIFFVPVKKLWIPFSIIITGSLVFRALSDTPVMHEFHTLSCIGDMTVGAFAAWFIQTVPAFRARVAATPKYLIATAWLLFVLIFFFRDEVLFANAGIRIFERLFIAILIAFLILEQCYAQHSLFKTGSFKIISKLGLITYGLYCTHFIGILIATTLTRKLGINTELWQVLLVDTLLALGITVVISKLSYRYFEGWFLGWKGRFAFTGVKK